MNAPPNGTLFRRSLTVLVFGFLLLALALIAYVWHLRMSASKLITEANQIHSTADAERMIATWPHGSRGYSESRSPDGNGRAYRMQVENGLLSKFRIAPNSSVMLEVVTRSGELQLLVLGMYTDRSSVWVQEDFTAKGSDSLTLNAQRDASGKPTKALIMFPAGLTEAEKTSAFALNATCLVKLGGCQNAQDILPAVLQLGAKQQ